MRSAMNAPRLLPGRGATDVDDAPAPAIIHLIINLIMMMMKLLNDGQ